MEVSIVAASHNNREDTIEFLKSIESLNFPKKQLEVIIVDNGSGDGTAESIKKVFPKIAVQPITLDFELGNFADATYSLKSDGSQNLMFLLGSTLGNQSQDLRT